MFLRGMGGYGLKLLLQPLILLRLTPEDKRIYNFHIPRTTPTNDLKKWLFQGANNMIVAFCQVKSKCLADNFICAWPRLLVREKNQPDDYEVLVLVWYWKNYNNAENCNQCPRWLSYFYWTKVYLGSNIWIQVSLSDKMTHWQTFCILNFPVSQLIVR